MIDRLVKDAMPLYQVGRDVSSQIGASGVVVERDRDGSDDVRFQVSELVFEIERRSEREVVNDLGGRLAIPHNWTGAAGVTKIEVDVVDVRRRTAARHESGKFRRCNREIGERRPCRLQQ